MYRLIKGSAVDDLAQKLAVAKRPTAVDTETTGVSIKESPVCKGQILLVSLYNPAVSRLPLVVDKEDLMRLRPFVESRNPKVLANLKYDAHMFANHGMLLQAICWDTVTADVVYDTTRYGRHGLKECVRDHLRYEMYDILKKGESSIYYYEREFERFVEYAAEDAIMTYTLARWQIEQLRQVSWGPYTLDRLLIKYLVPYDIALWKMGRRGIYVDEEYFQGIIRRMGTEVAQKEAAIYEKIGRVINLNSPDQIADVLYNQFKVTPPRFTETKVCGACGKKATKRTNYICKEHGDAHLKPVPSTDATTLETIKHPVAALLRERRKTSKLQDYCREYIRHRRADGRIHPNFKVYGADTGRLSSSGPNLQNVPAREKIWGIRGGFIAPPGKVLICVDYSQLEYRIMAHMCQDPKLMKYIHDGHDIHAAVAHKLYKLDCPIEKVEELYPDKRKSGKNINFGILYGMGPRRLAQAIGCSKKAAEKLLEEYFDEYPYLRVRIEQVKEECRGNGYVTTILKRRRHLPNILSLDTGLAAQAERQAANTSIQGSAADIIMAAQIKVDQNKELLEHNCLMLLQVHDELLFEVPEEEAEACCPIIQNIMEHPLTRDLRVPLEAKPKIGRSWKEAK